MLDILLDFPVFAPVATVFDAVSTPAGLDRWWTVRSAGRPIGGTTFALVLVRGYLWQRIVRNSEPPLLFELKIEDAVSDWLGTHVRFELNVVGDEHTVMRFAHTGWGALTHHYRTPCL